MTGNKHVLQPVTGSAMFYLHSHSGMCQMMPSNQRSTKNESSHRQKRRIARRFTYAVLCCAVIRYNLCGAVGVSEASLFEKCASLMFWRGNGVAKNFERPLQRYRSRDSQKHALGHAYSYPKACHKQSMEQNSENNPVEKQKQISNHSGETGNTWHRMHLPLIRVSFKQFQEWV